MSFPGYSYVNLPTVHPSPLLIQFAGHHRSSAMIAAALDAHLAYITLYMLPWHLRFVGTTFRPTTASRLTPLYSNDYACRTSSPQGHTNSTRLFILHSQTLYNVQTFSSSFGIWCHGDLRNESHHIKDMSIVSRTWRYYSSIS